MDSSPDTLDIRIGARIRALRTAAGLTIDELAQRSGVSRAMISRIERGESSATAQLLGRLTGGLDMTLARLFTPEAADGSPLARLADQPVWRDPGSGYLRRSATPGSAEGILDLAEVELPAGAIVPFDRQPGTPADQLVWLREGTLVLGLGEAVHTLCPGDCLHMRLDEQPITFRNPGPGPARYAIVLAYGRRGGR